MTENPKDGIMTLNEAVSWREKLRKAGKKLVITNGCFDLLHRGHAEYMYESRNLGDALLVLTNSDAHYLWDLSQGENFLFSNNFLADLGLK